MRIPSQFNEDSLYRRGSRRDESAQTNRRLIRLVLGLALVIVVMRQASRPEIYQTFFGPRAAPAQRADTSVGDPPPASKPGLPEQPVTPEDRHVANRITQELRPSDQRQWVIALSRWQRGRPVETVPSTVESIRDQIASLEISDQQRLSWEVMIDSFVKGATSKGGPTSIDQPRVAALLEALDEAAAARVVDGSVWRAGDFDSFYRYLDQAGDLSEAGIAATGVLPLLQQPDVFRNQLVLARGGVARAELIDAKENPYGIKEYWQLWLRPADGADRPLVAIVREVPPIVLQAVGSEAILEEGPRVTVVGRFLKRLAYQSAIGADLAPVVVGRITTAPLTEVEVATPAEMGHSPGRLWLTLFIACLIGLGLAAVTMWRTAAMAKRTRQLRQAHQRVSGEFLQDLGDSPDQATRSIESNNEEDS